RVEDPAAPDQPRTLHLLPSGPRWDEQAVAHLEAVLAPVTAARPAPARPAEENRRCCWGSTPPGRGAPPSPAGTSPAPPPRSCRSAPTHAPATTTRCCWP